MAVLPVWSVAGLRWLARSGRPHPLESLSPDESRLPKQANLYGNGARRESRALPKLSI